MIEIEGLRHKRANAQQSDRQSAAHGKQGNRRLHEGEPLKIVREKGSRNGPFGAMRVHRDGRIPLGIWQQNLASESNSNSRGYNRPFFDTDRVDCEA